MSAVYLYCVVHAPKAPSLSRAPAGVPGAGPLGCATVGVSLWAVWSEVPIDRYGSDALERTLADLDRVAPIALAHDAVVEHLFRQRGATVVPMKLFTMFSSLERAVEETAARRRDIRAAAKRIAGCEEWGVRVTRQAATATRTRAVEAASGAEFLAARRDQRAAARAEVEAAAAAAAAAFRALSAVARDVRRRDEAPPGATAPPLLDAVFLVARASRARFTAVARRLAAASGASGNLLTVSGPWPAYNFVQPGNRA